MVTCICVKFWIFMISFIGKVKRGEVVSSRLNDKVKEDWSSFQHRSAERAELSLLGTYPSPSSIHSECSAGFGGEEPHLKLASAVALGESRANKGVQCAMCAGCDSSKTSWQRHRYGQSPRSFQEKEKKKKHLENKAWDLELGNFPAANPGMLGRQEAVTCFSTYKCCCSFPLISLCSLVRKFKKNAQSCTKVNI